VSETLLESEEGLKRTLNRLGAAGTKVMGGRLVLARNKAPVGKENAEGNSKEPRGGAVDGVSQGETSLEMCVSSGSGSACPVRSLGS
jgi:hypothetical protein